MLDLSLILNPEKLYVLSISGGVDSMVLLHYFHYNNLDAIIVSFDHQTRSETKNEVELVKKTALKYNYPFYSFKLNIDDNGNFHELARNLRYKHLTSIANQYNTRYIVTAHHLDDLAETIIMRMMRETSIFAYSGMMPQYETSNKMSLLKPFLFINKKHIMDYAHKHKIKYLEDQSNYENKYMRNYIRNKVIPKLINTHENFYKSLLSFYYANNKLYDYLQSFFTTFIDSSNINEIKIDLPIFLNLSLNLQIELLTLLASNYNYYPSKKHLVEIIKQLSLNQPNIIINWGESHILIKQYDLIRVSSMIDVNNKPNIIISHNKPYHNNENIKICYNKLDFPVVIRRPKPGDLLTFPYGRKKLSRLLIDLKIDYLSRKQLWVIADQSGTIIAVPNIYVNNELGNGKTLYLIINPED